MSEYERKIESIRDALLAACAFADTVGPNTTPGECNIVVHKILGALQALESLQVPPAPEVVEGEGMRR